MKPYVIRKEVILQHSAVIFAESEEQAEKILDDMDTDLMHWEEFPHTRWIEPAEDWENEGLPVAIQTKTGYRMVISKDGV